MFSTLRKKIASGIVLLILALGILSLVLTDFGTSGMGGIGALGGSGGQRTETLATVDGTTLDATRVTDMINRQFQRAREQDPNLTMETFLAEGMYDQTVRQMITAMAVQSFGERQGLVVSQLMVDREIANLPAFRNFTGQFDDATFRQTLQAMNMTEGQLREDIGRSLMQRQLLGPVALGARVPEGVAREYANLLLERRRGTIARIPAELMSAGIEPTDAEIANFYRTARARFTVPERRVIKYAVLSAADLQVAAPTEAEIAAAYREASAEYGPRETRTLQQVVLPTRQAAEQFAARVRGGTGFNDAAAGAGFSASDVTFTNQTRAQFAEVTSPQVAAAGFTGAQGSVAGPIQSELGFHVVRVEAIQATPARPLEAVRAEVAATVAQRKRTDALQALITRIEDRLSEGASFDEIARAERLTVVTTPPVTSAGQRAGPRPADSPPWTAPAELQPLLRTAFDIDAEDPEPVVEQIEADARFALLGVDRVEPAAPPPLAQIRDEVRAALIRQRGLERARELARRIVGRINGGTPAAQALAEAGVRLPPAESVNMRRIDIGRAGTRPPDSIIALFHLPERRAQIQPIADNSGWYVVVHEQRTSGDAGTDPAALTAMRSELGGQVAEELAQQFARAAETGGNVTRDEAAIRRARQSAMGAASAN